jgi:hypothetical protein
MSSFVLSVRDKISGQDSFGKSVGSVTYLEVDDADAEPLPSRKVSLSDWMSGIISAAKPDGTTPGNELDVVFCVHGYNTSAREALVRQRLIERELRNRHYACVVVGFDWPTAENAALYLSDRHKAQETASALVKGAIIPFTKFPSKDCVINVHLMAHSMGAYVVREAFNWIDDARDASLSNDWRIGQLVFYAGDVASDTFALGSTKMQSVFSHCGRLTNYFSGYDEVLAASNVKNLDISSRVGRVGMPANTPAHDKAVDVDCGPRYKHVPNRTPFQVIDGVCSHSWYLEDPVWYDDLALTLQGDIDRNLFPTRTRATGTDTNDFVLNLERAQ